MKNSKRKLLKRNAIAIISIASMLTFSISNSMFIHGVNEIDSFAPNISNEFQDRAITNNQEITEYEISRTSQSGNSVRYEIRYKENGVWKWVNTKDDYVKRTWYQYASDAYHYGPEVSLGDVGDDYYTSGNRSYTPEFSIKYTGERPTYEVVHPADPGSWTNPYSPDGTGDNPDTDLIDESIDDKPEWIETVLDDWPAPWSAFASSYSGWIQEGVYNPNNNVEYDYYWSNFDVKISEFPKLNKDWTYTYKNEGSWNQHIYNHWEWRGSDYWKLPDRVLTGQGNEDVYVNWEILSNDVLVDSGKQTIFTKDKVTMSNSSFAANQPKPTSDYDLTGSNEYKKHSSTPPTINVPTPNESDWYGVEGSVYLDIDNLPIGWEYQFNADLMYKDKDGIERKYGSFTDNFSTTKNNTSSIDIGSYSNNEDSISFGYRVNDPNNIRISDVQWEFEGTEGTYYSGTSQSNYFYNTFDVKKGEAARFNVSYDYSLANDYSGKPSSVSRQTENSELVYTNEFYENKVDDFEIWVDNIQDDYFIFNYYISTNNNWLPYLTEVEIMTNTGVNKKIPNAKLGTSSFVVDTTIPEFSSLDNNEFNIKAKLNFDDSSITPIESNDISVNTKTNLIKDFSMTILGNEYIANTESGINYVMDFSNVSLEEIEFKYSLNNVWYDLEPEETNLVQNLELLNLKEDTEYELYFMARTDVRDYYSNNFKFKTDRSSSISFNEEEKNSGAGEHSAFMRFDVDKWEYIDNPIYNWNVIDKENDRVVFEGTNTITHDGEHVLFVDGLESNHEYRIVINQEIEGEIFMLYQDVQTSLNRNDLINNAYLTDVSREKSKYIIQFEGKVMSVQYSFDKGITWYDAMFSLNYDNGEIEVYDVPLPAYNEGILFTVNNQMRSQITYYDGIENSLIIPKDPIEINSNLLVFWILLIFIVLTIICATTWGLLYKREEKDSKTIEGNIWHQ